MTENRFIIDNGSVAVNSGGSGNCSGGGSSGGGDGGGGGGEFLPATEHQSPAAGLVPVCHPTNIPSSAIDRTSVLFSS